MCNKAEAGVCVIIDELEDTIIDLETEVKDLKNELEMKDMQISILEKEKIALKLKMQSEVEYYYHLGVRE